jgi:hypothetical protein
VINCGVAGYGLRQQLIYYDILGLSYHPDLILLALTADAVATPPYDGSGEPHSALAALLELERKTAENGARLVVVLLADSRATQGSDALRRFSEAIVASAPQLALYEIDLPGSLARSGGVDTAPDWTELQGSSLALANDRAARQVAARLITLLGS